MLMFSNVNNVQDLNRYVDDMLKLNFNSRYMTELYRTKKEQNGYLSEEEEKDFLIHCSILYVTSVFFSYAYDNYISSANVNDDKRLADMADEHSKGVRFNNYSFGAVDSKYMNDMLYNLRHSANSLFDADKEIIMRELMGNDMGNYDVDKKLEEFGNVLSPDEKRAILDKVMLTFCLYSTLSFNNNVTPDKELSRALFEQNGIPLEQVNQLVDYRELLAKYGIDLREPSKSFVSEGLVGQEYGRKSSRR